MSAISAGEAYVEVTCDTESAMRSINAFSDTIRSTARLVRESEDDLSPKANGDGLNDANDSLEKLKERVLKVAEHIRNVSNSVVSAAIDFSNYADSFDKMSQRVGMSSETLSELSYAATLSGTSIERVEDSFKDLTQTIVEAVNKGGDADALFS